MATVQSIVQVPAQASQSGSNRPLRAATTWSNPPANYARPWRSSPLAGPAFSTLPPIFAGSSEESLASPEPARQFVQSRSYSSSSIASQGSLSPSPYASSNPSGLLLDEGEASTSSVSPATSTSAHGATSSSHGYSSSQSSSHRPARLSKSWVRRKSMAAAQERGNAPPKNVTEAPVTTPARARTISHGHSRPVSFPVVPVAATNTMPPAYSRTSQLHPESNNVKQPPSVSRDPASNWVSSSPFGPAATPKFSRLAMASPAVVMPLSAKEYRKRKARESVVNGKGKDKESAMSSNHVTFVDDNASSVTSNIPNGVPVVTVSPPPSENVDLSPASPGDAPSPQQQPPPKQQPYALSAPSQPRPSPNYPRSRSRPNTPPRSSPLATQPPISPKSSTGTFYSLAPASDDETAPRPQGKDDPNATTDPPPARPRPRPRRRKSYPDRLSNGARLSFIEAMNRLSQGSVPSQTDDKNGNDDNRLSTVSQASGHTLFYDVGDTAGPAVGDDPQAPSSPRVGLKKRPSATQSLENLASTRMGGETAYDSSDEARRMAKRNVRMVRISDTVEVSPSPVHRRRKLTKSRPVSLRGEVPPQPQLQGRRVSLLPWKSKRVEESKRGVELAAGTTDKGTNGTELVHVREATSSTPPSPVINTGPSPHSRYESDHTLCESPTSTPTPAMPEPEPTLDSRKTRRSTFGFLSTPSFRPKREREKSSTLDLGKADSNEHTSAHVHVVSKGIPKSTESGTDSTSTSIHTIAQGSQTTLVPTSGSVTPPLHELASIATSAVPMVRRLNSQAAGVLDEPLPNPWESRGSSTPSLVTMGSTATSSSTPRTLTASSFVPRPSTLKASFTDTSEEEDRLYLRVSTHLGCPSARAGSRPGSAGSTGTETSGSYVSLSTVPASTVSASASNSGSTSRSDSPERRVGVQKESEGGCEACTLCGHVGRGTSPPPPPTYTSSMHPMFTVPLVTVPATGVDVPARSGTKGGKGVPHNLMVPVYGHGHGHEGRAEVDLDGGVGHGPVAPTRSRTMGDRLEVPNVRSQSKVRKQRRPQTAPAGGEDAMGYVEETKTIVNVDVDFGTSRRAAKHKGGPSRLKTVLKGLLKWGG